MPSRLSQVRSLLAGIRPGRFSDLADLGTPPLEQGQRRKRLGPRYHRLAPRPDESCRSQSLCLHLSPRSGLFFGCSRGKCLRPCRSADNRMNVSAGVLVSTLEPQADGLAKFPTSACICCLSERMDCRMNKHTCLDTCSLSAHIHLWLALLANQTEGSSQKRTVPRDSVFSTSHSW